MIRVYATVNGNYAMIINKKRIKKDVDNELLIGKVLVMDEEYYFKYAYEYNNNRIILISNNKKLEDNYNVEVYSNIEKLVDNPAFCNYELYIVGGYTLLKQGLKIADKLTLNFVRDWEDESIGMYFPNIDNSEWTVKDRNECLSGVNQIVLSKNKYSKNHSKK